jgi:UDP-hydrolysing UDP-N-acetyl-D-glucosamine 2-epimerase
MLYRFGSAIDTIRADGFRPNATIYCNVEGDNPATMAKSTGLAILELSTAFRDLAPDVVLTVADRYETLANAIAASYMNIAVAHTQGGEVSGSIDEAVRHAVTKLSHIHFPATVRGEQILHKLGEDPAKVFRTGCPALDLASDLDLTLTQDVLDRYGGTGSSLDFRQPFCLVVQHPVTTEYGRAAAQIDETIAAVDALGMQTVWLWPNIDAGSDDISKRIRMYRELRDPKHVHFYRNFSPEDYLRFLAAASCIIGNSSSGLREAALLGTPCVNIGTRQSLRERGANVSDVSYDAGAIAGAVRQQLAHGRYPTDDLYGDGKAGRRIAEILSTVSLDVNKRLHYELP